jgi:hypothetical protein
MNLLCLGLRGIHACAATRNAYLNNAFEFVSRPKPFRTQASDVKPPSTGWGTVTMETNTEYRCQCSPPSVEFANDL